MSPQPAPISPSDAVPHAPSSREERRFFWIAVAYELLILIAIGGVSC